MGIFDNRLYARLVGGFSRLIALSLLCALPGLADKMHLFEQVGHDEMVIVVHVATPTGSNSASVTWVDVQRGVVARKIQDCTDSGSTCRASILVGASQPEIEEISTAEMNALVAGTTTEYVMRIPAFQCTGGGRAACVEALVDAEVTRQQNISAKKYAWYGMKLN